MTVINSAIGASSFAQPTTEAAPQAQPEQKPVQPVAAPQSNMQRNLDLESLIFSGRIERVITVGGLEFKMHTMTNSEEKMVFGLLTESAREDVVTNALEFRNIRLSIAIDSINGKSLEEGYSGHETNLYKARLSVIDDWQSVLCEKLNDEYEEMLSESKKAIFGEDLAKDKDSDGEAWDNVKKSQTT